MVGWNEFVRRGRGFGLSLSQLMVLSVVRTRVPLPYEQMPRWVLLELDHLDLPCHVEDIQQAIIEAEIQGLLRISKRTRSIELTASGRGLVSDLLQPEGSTTTEP